MLHSSIESLVICIMTHSKKTRCDHDRIVTQFSDKKKPEHVGLFFQDM